MLVVGAIFLIMPLHSKEGVAFFLIKLKRGKGSAVAECKKVLLLRLRDEINSEHKFPGSPSAIYLKKG